MVETAHQTASMIRREGLPLVLLCKSPSYGNLLGDSTPRGAKAPEVAKATMTKAANRRWELQRIARRNGPPPMFRLLQAIAR